MLNQNYITLTEEHIKQIYALNLGLHTNNAAHAIDGIVNAARVENRLPLDEAVACYCKNQQSSYEFWLSKVKDFSDKHKVSLASAVSILEDVNSLKELYWPTGMTNNYLFKFDADSKVSGS